MVPRLMECTWFNLTTKNPFKRCVTRQLRAVDGQSFKDEWMDQWTSTWDGKTTEWDLEI